MMCHSFIDDLNKKNCIYFFSDIINKERDNYERSNIDQSLDT